MRTPAGSPNELEREIASEIRRSGPIPFSRFMELALYHSRLGYYEREPSPIGPEGDYFTASDAGTAFGECMARQLEEMDEVVGRPGPFTVVEFGAGRGLLARDVLRALEERGSGLFHRLRYVLVERSEALRRRARIEAPAARIAAPESLPRGAVGCALAVELFDALPVHRVRRRQGRLVEVLVGTDGSGRLVEVDGEPSEEVSAWAVRYGVAPGEGDEGEVSTEAGRQLGAMAAAIGKGFVLIVDYGDDAASLYGPRRAAGTLLAYRRHRTSGDLLASPGEQDLTSHVNFTALQEHARECGLVFLGRTTQERFLVAAGILERFDTREDSVWRRPSDVRRRLQALQLIHPEGMGRAFHVLAFSKGLDPPPRLRAFQKGAPLSEVESARARPRRGGKP